MVELNSESRAGMQTGEGGWVGGGGGVQGLTGQVREQE